MLVTLGQDGVVEWFIGVVLVLKTATQLRDYHGARCQAHLSVTLGSSELLSEPLLLHWWIQWFITSCLNFNTQSQDTYTLMCRHGLLCEDQSPDEWLIIPIIPFKVGHCSHCCGLEGSHDSAISDQVYSLPARRVQCSNKLLWVMPRFIDVILV